MSNQAKYPNMGYRIPFSRSILAVAVSMALVPFNGHAALKASDIVLPNELQTGQIGLIRSGKHSNGSVFVWQSGNALYAQRFSKKGELDDKAIAVVGKDADLGLGVAVNSDGSFLTAWGGEGYVWGSKTEAKQPQETPFLVGDLNSAPSIVALKKSDGFALAWGSSLFSFDETTEPTGELELASELGAIAMDSEGDFWVVDSDGYSLNVRKNDSDEEVVDVPPTQTVATYDFEENEKNKNKRVEFDVTQPAIADGGNGDFVLVWEEIKTETTRKTKNVCETYDGQKYCEDQYVYTYNPTTNVLAQRYNKTLTPKDAKPLVVATVKGAGTYIDDIAVVMDGDGDFTVAYSSGKLTEKTKTFKDDYGYSYEDTYLLDQSDVSVRQFATNKGKFVGGKAVKVSTKPKASKGHALTNVTHNAPSVVITDETSNAFIILWHNDYEDHFKQPNEEYACLKYQTKKYDGYAYKECVKYGYKTVLQDVFDEKSLLKAKRYSN